MSARPQSREGSIQFGTSLRDQLTAIREPLLFGVRLWASVCLALFVAFWLELDNPFWAGASAAAVCQPQLGASLRKGWFRMIGTVVGATAIVVMTAWFPQDRIGFLGLLALWIGVCAFTATVLRNFASYSAALAGYTAALIAADNLGATGGASSDVFMLAVTRASEICIGIVCAGIILAGTNLGSAQRQLAAAFANLAAEISGPFTRMLALAGPQIPDTKNERRELVRRVIALEPTIDQALGESSHVRYHSPKLQTAVHGLFRAIEGWRAVATHLKLMPDDADCRGVESILRSIPSELRSAREPGAPARWIADPMAFRRDCEKAMRGLLALPASTPSLRLLADETAKVLAGIVHVLDGLALLVDAPDRRSPRHRGFRLSVPDWLPALVNAARALVAIGAIELFWLATAWPHGTLAMLFVAIVILLSSPKGDLAYHNAIAFVLGTAGFVLCAAIIEFSVLPALATFPTFCIAIGLFLLPAGFAVAQNWTPAVKGAFAPSGFLFLAALAPTNQMSYDTTEFYNSALAMVAGCGVAALAFRLLPPPSPAWRARRLLALTLRDLRRLAIGSPLKSSEDWESRVYGRLAALTDQAEPVQRARLLAALSVGAEIIQLRRVAPRLGVTAELNAALKPFAQGNSGTAMAWLRQLERRVNSASEDGRNAVLVVRARSRILIVSEALVQHATYFDAGACA
jgi:uncharacterized membrane protein YccC